MAEVVFKGKTIAIETATAKIQEAGFVDCESISLVAGSIIEWKVSNMTMKFKIAGLSDAYQGVIRLFVYTVNDDGSISKDVSPFLSYNPKEFKVIN